MRRRNQLADLRRLISLPPSKMRRVAPDYLYEDFPTILKMLFRLIYSEKLTRQKRANLLSLIRYALDHYCPSPLPEWLMDELHRLLQTHRISKSEKAEILSSFNPDELFERLEGFAEFIESFSEFREPFGEYLIGELHKNPTLLHEMYNLITEKVVPDGLVSLIDDLVGYDDLEVMRFLELFTYHSNPEISWRALETIESIQTQEAVRRLYSISQLNPRLRKEAEKAYISLMHELPMPTERELQTQQPQSSFKDLWISLVDGNGALSVFLGKKTGRNGYLVSSILLKHYVGVKEVILLTNISSEEYKQVKNAYFSELNFYPVEEDYLRQIVQHFLKKNQINQKAPPVEFLILKNIIGWDDIEPINYIINIPDFKPLDYRVDDLLKFPLDTWWMHERSIYDILRPYRNKDIVDIPDSVFMRVAGLFLDYARRELVPYCELCADIISRSRYNRRTRLIRLFLTIREEILSVKEGREQESQFIVYNVITTINNTLHNLSLNIESPEDIP